MDTEYTEFLRQKTVSRSTSGRFDLGQRSVAIRAQKMNLIFNVQRMKKWKMILQFVVNILTAALTALGTTSCMGHGPF